MYNSTRFSARLFTIIEKKLHKNPTLNSTLNLVFVVVTSRSRRSRGYDKGIDGGGCGVVDVEDDRRGGVVVDVEADGGGGRVVDVKVDGGGCGGGD